MRSKRLHPLLDVLVENLQTFQEAVIIVIVNLTLITKKMDYNLILAASADPEMNPFVRADSLDTEMFPVSFLFFVTLCFVSAALARRKLIYSPATSQKPLN